MTLVSSGPISMGDINVELGRARNTANSSLQALANLAKTNSTPYINRVSPKLSHWYGYVHVDTISPTMPTNFTINSSWVTLPDHNDLLQWTASTDNVGVTGYDVFLHKGGAWIADFATTTTNFGVYRAPTYYNSDYFTSRWGTGYYYFSVRARDAAGNVSAYTAYLSIYLVAADTTAPNAPTLSSIVNQADPSITLNWTTPYDNVGVTGYKLYVSAGGSAYSELLDQASTSYVDYEVYPGSNYSYKVRAYDAVGNISSYSNSVSRTITGSCFVEGTLITLPDGTQMPIETLVMNQLLLSAEIETLKDTNNVLELYKWNSNFLRESRISSPITKIEPKIAYETIIINEGLLEATPSHSQLIQRDGIWKFIPLGSVVVGDKLYGINTEIIAITSVLVNLEKRNIYPLTLNPSHTYFANGILTHNYKPIEQV